MSVESGSFLAWKELFAPWVSVELPVAERKCLGAPKVLVIPFSNGTVLSLPVWIQLALAEIARDLFLNIVLCVIIFLACFCFYDGIYA